MSDLSYLSSVPKPLLDNIVRGRVVPIIGSGFSKNAIIPEGLVMSDWDELGELVADQLADYEYKNDAIDALSYYEHEFGRSNLVELLRDALHADEVRPGEVHTLLCELFSGTICTTNWDFLLEDAAKQLYRPSSVIVSEDALTISGRREGRLLKLHGDFNHPERMVITEYDYDVYLERNPVFATHLANLFITETMLLIGYSLEDSDFRNVWQIINSRLGRMTRQAYAIEVDATQAKIERFKRRNIRVINLPKHPGGYKESLRCFLGELKEYVDAERDKAARSTSEAVNEQLVIPAEHNMLCYISCSMARIARLSSLIYPALQEAGVTPVRIDNMIMPGDNWFDIAETTLRKSRFVIVDLSDSSQNVASEAGAAMAMKKDVLFICEEGSLIPFSISDRKVLTYTFEPSESKLQFLRSLLEWVMKASDHTNSDAPNPSKPLGNAQRLLERGEYSACIVLACSELEHFVRNRYPELSKERVTLGYLREFLANKMDITLVDSDRFSELISLRNRIVHESYQTTREEAENMLDYISSVERQISQ